MANETQQTSRAEFVTVGCKLPHGLNLDLKTTGGEVIRHTLKGANDSRIIGGYGITVGVPNEFMSQWLKKNARHPAVVNGSIFIHDDLKSAESIARERRDILSGLEAIDPVRDGMLKDDKGNLDRGALANYNEQRSKNPERNRQQVE